MARRTDRVAVHTLAQVRHAAAKAALAREEYEAAIRAAVDGGLPVRLVADAAGLSHGRIHQIVHGSS
ncbi:MAG TPA: hypothetical protein VLA89_08770 [Gemmatimonadales bacterium]|nr:hypothetical protein [Gemmatimonadales bacterium]